MATVRFSTLATVLRRGAGARIGTPEDVIARAQLAEARGFAVIALADLGAAQVFPALTLAASVTSRAEISTRVLGVFTHSPVLFASGASWLQRISNGRFSLGLGPSLPEFVEGVFGGRFANPAGRMADTLKLIRALFGEPMPGASRNTDGSIHFAGATMTIPNAVLDLPLIHPRPKLYVAASGPRMLQTAGAWADGAIIEFTTPGYVRWAWEQIARGAAQVGRTLTHFDIHAETTIFTETDDPTLQARQASWMLSFLNHCRWEQFDQLWKPAGLFDAALAVRAAMMIGDLAEAERIARREMLHHVCVTGPLDEAPDRFREWLAARVAVGVTTFAMPLEMPELLRVGPLEAERFASGLPEPAFPRPSPPSTIADNG